MKKLKIFVLCSLVMALQYASLFDSHATSFTDVPSTYWANQYIQFLSERNITNGYPNGTFKPEKPVSRAEFAVMLAKSQNVSNKNTSASSNRFTDLNPSHWSSSSVNAVSEQGWITGYPGNKFLPNKSISMTEMYVVLSKVLGKTATSSSFETLNNFSDRNLIPGWAQSSVANIVKEGLAVTEAHPSELRPMASATRADVATALAKLLNESFRSKTTNTNSSKNSLGQAISISGTLQAVGTVGEWQVQGDNGVQYYLNNIDQYSNQSWFQNGSKVHLEGNLDPRTNSSSRTYVLVKQLKPDSMAASTITINGTLQPSTYTQGAWVVRSSTGNQTYRILNPEKFSSNSWFRYGASVSLKGIPRPDVQVQSGEGTAILASEITNNINTSTQSTQFTGKLRQTSQAGGWYLETSNNQKYVLTGIENELNETWFQAGSEVNVKGTIRNDIPTIYSEGAVLMVTEITPSSNSIAGAQQVQLFFPNIVNSLSPIPIVGQATTREIEGPNLPSKALTALLQGPSQSERILGFKQNPAASNLSLETLIVSAQKARVELMAPNEFTPQNNSLQQLNQQIAKTLLQFPDIKSVDISIKRANNQTIIETTGLQ